jgi:hypothetical protein
VRRRTEQYRWHIEREQTHAEGHEMKPRKHIDGGGAVRMAVESNERDPVQIEPLPSDDNAVRAATTSTLTSQSATERMRLHRERRRAGLRRVSITLHVTEIEALIRRGYLDPDGRENNEYLPGAISNLLHDLENDFV